MRFTIRLQELDRTQIATAGGKGASLGELTRIDGVRVPPGFCVTTTAFRTAGAAGGVPDVVAAAIQVELDRLGRATTYAVRSSATAEDLPSASFAGQHDSFLNVAAADVVDHVRRCWASLDTERAIAYRRQNDIDRGTVEMAVVVQQMVQPRAAGVVFTADPVTSNRRVASIDAVSGLAEELVSGRVTPETYKVREGALIESRAVASAAPLSTDEATGLVALARRIEAHFGAPQDIEWCLDADGFAIVQSRPITTLFPLPVVVDDAPHVYVSVGHQQMMTDAMRPLGWSMWQAKALPPMHEAAGRLFVDVAPHLASPTRRAALLGLWQSDPLIGSALQTVVDRGFIPTVADAPPPAPADAPPEPPELPNDPTIVAELIDRWRATNAATAERLAGRTGGTLLDAIVADIADLKTVLFEARSRRTIMAGMEAAWWLGDHLEEWLGERNAIDVLTQSVDGNPTSEMGLALLDLADVIRPHAEVVAHLERGGDDVLDGLEALPGGAAVRAAIDDYLERYGMRCVGEIDITRPRWAEQPSLLVPMILSNVSNFAPGAAGARFEQGRREAEQKREEVLTRLRALPDGDTKAAEAEWHIDRVRAFAGYREYPKYGIVSRSLLYKRALMGEAARLVEAGVLAQIDDLFYLTLTELIGVVAEQSADPALIAERRAAFDRFSRMTPPRVLTSEGESVAGSYGRDDMPDGALVGLAVSRGTVVGRARVLSDVGDADLEPGDILVTTFTDPSWSPLFLTAGGLVTEVGGLMTHGAVIAREYGLPAVVGVEEAMRLIRDGQQIRVDGTNGTVELLG